MIIGFPTQRAQIGYRPEIQCQSRDTPYISAPDRIIVGMFYGHGYITLKNSHIHPITERLGNAIYIPYYPRNMAPHTHQSRSEIK